MWARLYLKKGQQDKALEVLQRQTYKVVGDLRACLASLMEQELGLERQRVLEICRIMEQLDRLFYIQGSSGLLSAATCAPGHQTAPAPAVVQSKRLFPTPVGSPVLSPG